MDFNILQQMKRNSIRVSYSPVKEDCAIGSSKIGGKPDLPKDFNWFYYKGKTWDEIEKNRPLSFLAQINCAEAKEYDSEGLLPDNGMLYFFYELESMTWGYDPAHKGSARVYYHSGSTEELVRTDFPADLLDDCKLPELAITFSSEEELPDFEEFREWQRDVEFDKWAIYDKARNEIIPSSEEGDITKLLGYANSIQGSMLMGCELSSNGVYTGNGSVDVPEDRMKQYEKDCVQWRVLFQLDSIRTSGYELMWGDCGRVYFYIKEEDLKALNFDNCWLILQCC